MGFQDNEFRKTEGDAWHKRNHAKWPERIEKDPVLFATSALKPRTVMEIGCGNGWRLEQYCFRGAKCWGVDPSNEAIASGRRLFPRIHLNVSSATDHDICNTYDLVIYGFCLYLCDRENLSEIVFSGDAIIEDGGHLVIHDFDPEFPHKVTYHHVPGLWSYKQDYSKLWLANPAYTLVSKTTAPDGTAVWVLKKDISNGWPTL